MRDGFVGVCSLAFYFWRLEAVSFYRCWCFYTLGLFSVISHTIIVHTFQPYGCLNIACFQVVKRSLGCRLLLKPLL